MHLPDKAAVHRVIFGTDARAEHQHSVGMPFMPANVAV